MNAKLQDKRRLVSLEDVNPALAGTDSKKLVIVRIISTLKTEGMEENEHF